MDDREAESELKDERNLLDYRIVKFTGQTCFLFFFIRFLRSLHVITGSCKCKMFALIFPLAGKSDLASLFSLC